MKKESRDELIATMIMTDAERQAKWSERNKKELVEAWNIIWEYHGVLGIEDLQRLYAIFERILGHEEMVK